MSTRPRRTAAVVASATIKNILTPAKPTPAATPIKATPVKATPVKATPVKATPAKASVAKASAKKEPSAAAATASARKRKTAATAPSTPVPSSRGASSRSKKVAVAAAVIEEEEEEEDEPMAVDPPAPKPKKAAPTPRATARSRKAAAEEEEEMVVDATPVKPKKAAPAPRSTRGKKAPPAPVFAEKVDEEDEEEEEEEKEEEAPAKKPNKAVAAAAAAPKAPTSRATARSRKAAADLAAAAAPEASAPEAPTDDVPAAAAAPPGPSSSSSVPIQENGDEEEALPAKKEEVEEKKKEETEKDDEGEEEVAMEVEEEEEVVAAPASTSTTAAVTTEPSTEAAASTTTTTAPITTGSKRKASESADEGEAGQVAVPAAAAAATSADLSKEQSSSSVTTTTTAAAAASEAAAPSTVATTTSTTTTKTSSTTSSSSSSKRLRRSWSSGDLFTLGEPLAGELGPREKTFRERRLKRCEPSRVKLPGGGKARLVACGAYHTLVLSEAGDTLFSFGVNDDGGLGRITSKQAAAENGEKEAEKKNGNAGDADAASSDDDASNSEQEEEDDDDYEEKMCAKVLPVRGDLAGRTLVKVTAGDMHSVALDSEGAVYLWGNLKDDSNKIGLFADDAKEGGDRLPTRVPRRVQLNTGDSNLASTKIVDIASGSHHVLLLTEAGEVLSLGEGSKGQLGRIEAADLDSIAAKRELFIVPGKVDFSKVAVPAEGSSAPPPKIRRIFAGQWASFALSESGTLYAWGLNNYFQLGFRTAAPVEMANGNGNSADTSINCPALSLHAELFPAVVPTTTTTKTKSSTATNNGENNNNNSENNNNNNSSTENSISMGEVVSVAVGQQHLTVLDSRGRVFTAGSVNYGKLGLGKAVLEKVGTEEAALDTLTPIPEAAFGGDRVEAVVCGDFSAFAITERGRLYGWGQGSAHIGTDVGEDAWEPRLMAGAYVEAREEGEGVRFISGSSGPQYGGWIGVIQEWAEETEKKA